MTAWFGEGKSITHGGEGDRRGLAELVAASGQ